MIGEISLISISIAQILKIEESFILPKVIQFSPYF